MSRVFDILYVIALVVALPWLIYRAVFRRRNRRGWGQKLFGSVPSRVSESPCIWMHAVSVGEVNLLSSIIDRLRVHRPDLEIVISTTTETGYDLAKKKYGDHQIFFFPLDFSWAIKRTIERVRPDLIVLAELEVWPNLVSIADANQIPVAVINGRLSESSFRGYWRWRWLFRPAFERLTLVAAANKEYAIRFMQMGTPSRQLTVTGSVKYDGVLTDRKNKKTRQLAALAGLQPDDFVIVAGSTQPDENLMVARVYQELASEFSNLRLILVPRHPETCASVQMSIKNMGLSVTLRSKLDASVLAESDIILVDVIGELSAWWGCVNAAFVGGSMGGAVGRNRGGQNMIEPAAYGVPVSFGPDTRNFREIVSQLLRIRAAAVVDHEADLKEFFRQTITNPRDAHQMGLRAKQLIQNHAGASDRTVDQLVELLPPCKTMRIQAA